LDNSLPMALRVVQVIVRAVILMSFAISFVSVPIYVNLAQFLLGMEGLVLLPILECLFKCDVLYLLCSNFI
jgi:hypothetical protein